MPVRVLACCAVLYAILGLSGCAHRARGTLAVLTRGERVYARECEACHGPQGAGTQIGPSLKNERSRRSYNSVLAIVNDPQSPMPKLYPGRLTQNEVKDVTAYVESL